METQGHELIPGCGLRQGASHMEFFHLQDIRSWSRSMDLNLALQQNHPRSFNCPHAQVIVQTVDSPCMGLQASVVSVSDDPNMQLNLKNYWARWSLDPHCPKLSSTNCLGTTCIPCTKISPHSRATDRTCIFTSAC